MSKKTVQDLILDKLDKLETKVDQLHTKYDEGALENAKEISALKVKSSIWGGVSGAVSGLAVVLIEMFKPR